MKTKTERYDAYQRKLSDKYGLRRMQKSARALADALGVTRLKLMEAFNKAKGRAK